VSLKQEQNLGEKRLKTIPSITKLDEKELSPNRRCQDDDILLAIGEYHS